MTADDVMGDDHEQRSKINSTSFSTVIYGCVARVWRDDDW